MAGDYFSILSCSEFRKKKLGIRQGWLENKLFDHLKSVQNWLLTNHCNIKVKYLLLFKNFLNQILIIADVRAGMAGRVGQKG